MCVVSVTHTDLIEESIAVVIAMEERVIHVESVRRRTRDEPRRCGGYRDVRHCPALSRCKMSSSSVERTCHNSELHPSGAARKVSLQMGHVTGPSCDDVPSAELSMDAGHDDHVTEPLVAYSLGYVYALAIGMSRMPPSGCKRGRSSTSDLQVIKATKRTPTLQRVRPDLPHASGEGPDDLPLCAKHQTRLCGDGLRQQRDEKNKDCYASHASATLTEKGPGA